MTEAPSTEELEAAHCWEADDRVPGRPATTEFRRTLRYHQARWREANGHPIGSQPIVPRDGKPCLRAFDTAFLLDQDGTQGIAGVDVKYHERLKPEVPKPSNLWRNLEVAERSSVFRPGATDEVKGRSELCVMWLEHLLLLSMLQHVSGAWSWGRYVVVHPAGNSSVADGCARYRDLLVDQSTFSSMTLEELLDAGALAPRTAATLRERYIPG